MRRAYYQERWVRACLPSNLFLRARISAKTQPAVGQSYPGRHIGHIGAQEWVRFFLSDGD
jgi:hypothetical protein